jgi:hypothetical protein
VLILAAAEGSRTDALAREALRRGMVFEVLDHPMNVHLVAAGARPRTAG